MSLIIQSSSNKKSIGKRLEQMGIKDRDISVKMKIDIKVLRSQSWLIELARMLWVVTVTSKIY